MCSINGFFGFKNNYNLTIKSLNLLKHRGNDSYGIYVNNKLFIKKDLNKLKNEKQEKSNFALGHNLFAIVNNIAQPLISKSSIFLTNCEIYNWEKLNEKYNFNAKNDAELFHNILDKTENLKLQEIDGVYAFAYLKENILYLKRDLLGIKPLFYFYDEENKKFAFSSEKKVLRDLINKEIIELNPITILKLNLENFKIEFIKQDFYKLGKPHIENNENLKIKTKELLINAIKKRLPSENKKIGLLFSGGIDSTFIAYVLQDLGIEFTCYTAKLEGGNIAEAEDLIYATEIAQKYNLNLKIASVKTSNLENEVKEVIKLVESREYIKTSVALPFLLSLKEAKKDGVKIIFSGLGSEEIFAGYRRHKKVSDPNLECLEGLKILHIRDLYRDDVLSMSQTIEMRLPFLDKELIKYSLDIPVKHKLNLDENRSKIILRDIALEMGLDKRYSERQKKAAQYGSKFDKGLLRLAKNSGLGKQDYLNNLDVGVNIESYFDENKGKKI